MPKASAVNPVDKANRELKNVTFQVTYTGAVHKVVINGSSPLTAGPSVMGLSGSIGYASSNIRSRASM